MFRAVFSAVGVWSLTLGTALLLASTVLAVAADRRAGLDADTLARSRGNNQGSKTDTRSCNTFNGCPACIADGDDCDTCDVDNYSVVTGGYVGLQTTKTVTQSCGDVYLGKCDKDLKCVKQGLELGKCAPPPKVVPQPIQP